MNIWLSQDEFHALCITLWASGFHEKEWEGFFIHCNVPYNKDWILMYMEMLDENFMAYMYVQNVLSQIVTDRDINNILLQEQQA